MNGETVLPTPESESAKTDESLDDVSKLTLPELTDEYVKTLGNAGQFNSVAEFKEKIKEHLTIEKAQDVDAAHRVKLTDAIIEKTEVVLPQIMIDAEMNQMFAQMEQDLTRANLKIDDYLGHIKKSREDLVLEWTPAAEKRAKLQLVLNAIAKKEDIKADPSLVDHQVSALLEQYKDADEERVRIYVMSILQNDAVMNMLDKA
jgi:trigger factor